MLVKGNKNCCSNRGFHCNSRCRKMSRSFESARLCYQYDIILKYQQFYRDFRVIYGWKCHNFHLTAPSFEEILLFRLQWTSNVENVHLWWCRHITDDTSVGFCRASAPKHTPGVLIDTVLCDHCQTRRCRYHSPYIYCQIIQYSFNLPHCCWIASKCCYLVFSILKVPFTNIDYWWLGHG